MPEHTICKKCGNPLPIAPCRHCLVGIVIDLSAPEEETAPVKPADLAGDKPELPWLFGDYELLEEIGRGGMGFVYRACQLSLNREVAVKMIRGGQLADEHQVRRFQTEAEAAACSG